VPLLFPRVLIVEDDAAIRGLLVAALRREPLTVDSAADGVEALALVRDTRYAVIVTDLMLPRLDGIAFIEEFRELQPQTVTVIFAMTAYDDMTVKRLGPRVHAVIRKPFDLAQLVSVIRECAHLNPTAGGGGIELFPEMPPPQRGDAC
jgi:two-component system response regulator AtoC